MLWFHFDYLDERSRRQSPTAGNAGIVVLRWDDDVMSQLTQSIEPRSRVPMRRPR
jgi:hypothetical protein